MEAAAPNFFSLLRRSASAIVLLLAVAALFTLGVTVLMSISRVGSGANEPFAIKQLIFLGVALCAGTFAALVDWEWLRRWWWVVALGTVGLFVAVLSPQLGHEVNGARRWFDFGPISLQATDPGRIGFLFVLCHILALAQRRMTDWRSGYAVPVAFIGLCFVLVMKQPDFGTALLMATVGFCLLLVAGARLRFVLPTIAVGLVLFAVAIALDPVRLSRITSFLDVEGNRSDSSYQLWQGILAFGVGGAHGVGLGNGRQQMSFLPEAQNDFIFPIIGEELGFALTATVATLFLVVFACGYWQLRRAPNLFQFLFALGALLFITFQALINMGMVTGLLPTKGMSLPFISYGGSNLVANFVLLGILINAAWRWREAPRRKPLEL